MFVSSVYDIYVVSMYKFTCIYKVYMYRCTYLYSIYVQVFMYLYHLCTDVHLFKVSMYRCTCMKRIRTVDWRSWWTMLNYPLIWPLNLFLRLSISLLVLVRQFYVTFSFWFSKKMFLNCALLS